MAHDIVIDPRFVEIVHTGPVGYAERLAALDAVSSAWGANPLLPVLINFLGATLEQESADFSNARADYIARATLHPFFSSRAIAMIGVSAEGARSAKSVAATRGVPLRCFETREAAIAWLTVPEPQPG